jgi:hypothetical protein
MRVVDVQDPSNPVEIGSYEPGPGYEAWSVASRGLYAFVGRVDAGVSGVDVIDMANPELPVEVGECAVTGIPRQLAVLGLTVFVAGEGGGMRVVDVSVVEGPVEIGHYLVPDDALGVGVSGIYVYLANLHAGGNMTNGLYVIDISSPTNPVEAGNQATPGHAWDVAVSGSLVYLADSDGGVAVFEECGGAIFSEGVELGDTSAWSGAL